MFSVSHLHPMLVHFPIALIIAGFALEVFHLIIKKEQCLSRAGFYLLILGTLGAIVAYLAGEFFTNDLAGAAGGIQETHELFASITLGTVILTLLVRLYLMIKKKEETSLRWVYFALYALSAIFVGITGFYGGTLVFSYMIGI
ncbi:MAG TPA: DUF2231 domain-containing protein [Williamwhitmania sp.]|nr:DUF2231 domain-containing protein [Williamwhitmania sp.]